MNAEAHAACPKCGHPRREAADACARCGLVYARWGPDLERQVAAGRLDERGEALWSAATARWDDPAAHDAFLKHCSVTGTLGPAGRRYRERLDADPSDGTARRMQERVLGMASTILVASRPVTAAPVTRSRWFWAVIALTFAVSVVGALLWARR